MSSITENLGRIQAAIQASAQRAGRDPSTVTIVGASKTKSAETINEAILAGLSDVGENYLQEAAAKKPNVNHAAKWHMIGHLQRNKAKRAAELFDVIQTVDTPALAAAIANAARPLQKTMDILLQVNIGAEATKAGVPVSDAKDLLRQCGQHPELRVTGLMAIPPQADSGNDSRSSFRALRELALQLRADAPANAPMNELSMGMSGDFEIAIEEGATMIRIGRALLGDR